MKNFILSTTILCAAFMLTGCKGQTAKASTTTPVGQVTVTDDDISKDAKIQVAILLDTSGSMDGLIEQAKSRLWNIVNTLTTLKFKGKTPVIEIALYEYGNDGISARENYIRQIVPLSTDLDLISEKLFALSTYGGSEFCGAVIDKSVKALEWGNRSSDMKLIYIAGNEPFTQGPTSYKTAITGALEKNIFVNTILCGGRSWGGEDEWRDGARIGKGKFFQIDHDLKVRYYNTPYDDRISQCNMKLNDTYIGYGSTGASKKESQIRQDDNAKSISSANYTERAVSKTGKAYTNSSWDLVDKVKEDKTALDKIKQSELPAELQNKSKEELTAFVAQKGKERNDLQKEIAELARKRQEYIDEQARKEGDDSGDDLGKAINESVLELAQAIGYKAEP